VMTFDSVSAMMSAPRVCVPLLITAISPKQSPVVSRLRMRLPLMTLSSPRPQISTSVKSRKRAAHAGCRIFRFGKLARACSACRLRKPAPGRGRNLPRSRSGVAVLGHRLADDGVEHGGIPGAALEGGGGVHVDDLIDHVVVVAGLKGRWPVSNWYITTPSE
jgi:hypothetical protein